MPRRKLCWFEAAQNGDEERMKELLADYPNFIVYLTDLHHACRNGFDKAVALLLAANPGLIDETIDGDRTALHWAASWGCDKIVAQLLAASPQSIHAVTGRKWTALHLAASMGYEERVTLLLAANPELITQVDEYGWTALHSAANANREKVVFQLLAACPQLIDARDDEGLNVLHYALRNKNQSMAEEMLAIKPEVIYAVSKSGDTALHQAVRNDVKKPFIAKLWQMHPQALHAVDKNSHTPFDLAVEKQREELVKLFRPSVCFDELASAYANKFLRQIDFQKRYKPAMKKRCESLLSDLNQDVASVVFEYLGFAPTIKKRPSKRAKLDRAIPARCYQLRNTHHAY